MTGRRAFAWARPVARALTISFGAIGMSGLGQAYSYIGASYLQVPGIDGGSRARPYPGWIRAEAHYWTARPPLPEIRRVSGLTFTGPDAPRDGPDVLNIAVAKTSPAFAPLMRLCAAGTIIPRLTYAESADRARDSQEFGFRPENVPEYYEYGLINAQLACPVVAGAPEQAFIIRFEAITRNNFAVHDRPAASAVRPARLGPSTLGGSSRTFAVTWFAAASDVSEDQCPTFNAKPTEADYYALMPPAEQPKVRAALAPRGGVTADVMPYRGPEQLNICHLPGIVADPGHRRPVSRIARGLNLDGAGGTAAHPDHVSPEGHAGIDNALFSIEGCVRGFQRKGIIPAVLNQGRIDGGSAIIVDISGIDDPRNDDRIDVTFLYSEDRMMKDATGAGILPDFTYRVSENPKFAQYMARLPGRIRNGEIVTAPVARLIVNQGSSAGMPFHDARLSLRIMPDGSLKGVLGAYLDVGDYLTNIMRRTSTWENGAGFQCPGIYNAVLRAADGMKDPDSGRYRGISAAFDIEGVPAMIPPAHRMRLSGVAARR